MPRGDEEDIRLLTEALNSLRAILPMVKNLQRRDTIMATIQTINAMRSAILAKARPTLPN